MTHGQFPYALLLGAALLATSVGCNSIKSTMLFRDESNMCWMKDNHLHGVPITLEVPTHLKVYVVEKHYLVATDVGGVTQISRLDVPVPVRGMRTEWIYTKKIFTVDFKRPAAGSMEMTLDFNEQQYFDEIKHKVVDETFEQVNQLVSTLAPLIFTPASTGGARVEENLKEIESVVAVQVFEVDEPDFEQKLTAFLQCHLNQSHDAWVMPPGVDQIRRLPLTEEYRADQRPVGLCPSGVECVPMDFAPQPAY